MMAFRNIKKSISSGYVYLLAAFIFCIGVLATAYIVFVVKGNEENFLLKRTDTIAQFINPETVKSLSGSLADLGNPDYQDIKKMLSDAAKVNLDVRFIYLMGMKNGEVFFFADSENPNSSDYSPPGQTYPEASQRLLSIFKNKKPLVEGIYSDRWGRWLSALTPILDPATGNVLALVGMDINASSYVNKVIVFSFIPALGTVFLLILVFIYSSIRRKEIKDLSLKAEFVSVAAHEIRSPLTALAWGTEVLIEKLKDKITPGDSDLLLELKNSSTNLLKTVNDILDLYALESHKLLPENGLLDINRLLKDVLDGFRLAASGKNIDLIFEEKITDGKIFGNESKIKRMFSNLISNAIKYSKPRGQVFVIAENAGENYLFTIADKGIGIPAEEQRQIFNGFYRASNARKIEADGTGLGLYYAKQIVDLCGGKIWLESIENGGTKFYITIRKKIS
jgi:signal transduction histidine kinase